jgi:hypothetical protein
MTEIDAERHVNAVRRTVGTTTLEAGDARVVTLRRSYRTDADDLWDACTNAERLPRWFAPVTGALELGGRYQVQGNAAGTVLTCDPPRSFTATWEFGGVVSWIEVRIGPDGPDAARLELDHIARVDDDPMWPTYGPGAVGLGWDLAVLGLALHLTGRPAPDENSFHQTADGRRFIQLAGESWYAAQRAAGTPDAQARSAADRTIAFYLGEPQN